MRYSEDWLAKISSTPFYEKRMSWDDVYKYYHFDNPRVRDEQKVVIFPEGVWMEISRLFNDGWYFEKVRCITKDNVYFDGSDSTNSLAMGSLSHVFRIDGHELDIRHLPETTAKTRQELLLDFINTYAGVSDNRLPPVPKGILKI